MASSPHADGQPIRVVIIDDDDSLRFLLERELRRRDPTGERWEVSTTASPEEGLQLIGSVHPGRPLFVLADYDLGAPRTGADVLAEIARFRPDATRVLFSGHPRAELQSGILRSQPTAFFEKPLRIEGLIDKLVALLSSPTAASSPISGTAHAGLSPTMHPTATGAPARFAPQASPDEVYHAMVNSVTDYALFMMDPEGFVRTWNPGAERILGYSADEIIGKHFSIFYPAAEVANWKPRFELKVAAEEGRYEETAWRVRKDGSMFWANVVVTRIVGENGELRGFVKVNRDLTERRHQEEALRQSEERYRLLVEGVRDYAIFMLDPTGRIASWNPGAQRIKGYSAEDIVGEHFSRFYTEVDRARNHPQEELRIAAATGSYEEEGWRVRKDGSRFWASVVITALYTSDGQLRGYAKVTRDLTQRRLNEEALRGRAAELSELARELEAFSYTVAHDLRAPLRAVIHLSELLVRRDDAEPVDPAEERRLLETIHTSATRMGQLVEDLLALSRASKGSFQAEDVDLGAAASAVAAEVAARMGATNTVVEVEDGLVAWVDPRLLRIVLENLLSNAIKFSQGKDKPRVRVGKADTPEGPAFYVQDNGVGFEEALSDRLYRPFQRLHGTNEFEGTGIGLATVARIIGRHGGRIWAESRPGEGATFFFTLPHPLAGDVTVGPAPGKGEGKRPRA